MLTGEVDNDLISLFVFVVQQGLAVRLVQMDLTLLSSSIKFSSSSSAFKHLVIKECAS